MKTAKRIHYSNSTRTQKEYIESRISAELGCCQSMLVSDALAKDFFGYDDIQNEYEKWEFSHGGECSVCHRADVTELNDNDICSECYEQDQRPQEIFEWWPINSSFLVKELLEIGEPVLSNDYGDWWGRTCTGQSISLDPTFWTIFQDGVVGVK